MDFRACTNCNVEKPKSDFHKEARSPDDCNFGKGSMSLEDWRGGVSA